MFNPVFDAEYPNRIIKPAAKLKILSINAQRQHGYLLIQGYVVNKSDQDLNHVVAVAECFSSSGTLITKSDMLVDDMTTKPKQVSSFSIAVDDTPDIKDVEISFKHFLAEKIEVDGCTTLRLT
jgi:hypothetical protein